MSDQPIRVAIMLDVSIQALLAKHLVRVEGRIVRIRLQVQNGTPCPDLLQDLASAQDALRQVGTAIIRFHVGRCVQTPSDEPDSGAQMAELIAIFDRFI